MSLNVQIKHRTDHFITATILNYINLNVCLDLLWCAPELLRMEKRPRCGTLEGDIYSFAIILYEIHGRKGPYGDMDMSPQGNMQYMLYLHNILNKLVACYI